MDGLENKFKEATVKSATSSTTTVPTSTPSQRGFTPRGRGGSYRGRYNFRRDRYRHRGAFQQQQQPASDTKTETTKSSSGSDKKTGDSFNPLNYVESSLRSKMKTQLLNLIAPVLKNLSCQE